MMVMVRSSFELSWESSPVKRSTKVPGPGKVTLVPGSSASANTAPGGPVTCVQVEAAVPGGSGRPSSSTNPASDAVFVGSVNVWSTPASTVGG
jgi:hypothetical protein